MRILLAGYNLDADVIDGLRSAKDRDDVTPETLSAAYARISRDPRPADELRAAARAEVEKARRSNRTIIFAMGHHSVAEHAVFNFDLIGVSRLALEAVEHFRLCSFTEKSQRYITLGSDFVVPDEVRGAGLAGLFEETVRAQNALYHRLYARLRPYAFERFRDAAADPRNHAVLDGWAKEDARYAVSLATEGQAGMTLNARNLELMIRRLRGHPLAEVRAIVTRLHDLAGEIAPSIVLFTEPSDFDARTPADLAALAEKSGGLPERSSPPRGRKSKPAVLAGVTADGDLRILAALMHSATSLSYEDCVARAGAMTAAARRSWFRTALRRMEFFDAPPREFEHADATFDLVVSASCFAQLKRHRMATLTVQPYDPALGATIPPSVREVGMEGEFRAIVDRAAEAHARIATAAGPAADYVLCNAHRRRALVRMNVRELYHFSRLREDASAQWEIRETAAAMSAAARKALPLSCMLLGGKDAYPGVFAKAFGHPPRQSPPRILK